MLLRNSRRLSCKAPLRNQKAVLTSGQYVVGYFCDTLDDLINAKGTQGKARLRTSGSPHVQSTGYPQLAVDGKATLLSASGLSEPLALWQGWLYALLNVSLSRNSNSVFEARQWSAQMLYHFHFLYAVTPIFAKFQSFVTDCQTSKDV